MTARTHITCPKSGHIARVVDGIEPNALVVATRELKTYYNDVSFFLNPNYGIDMNQNAGFGGTPVEVHNGIDDVLWTASSITGVKFTFNSGDQNHTPAGSTSVRIDNPALNDVMEFDKGSDQSLNGYTAISLWIYIDKDWAINDSVSLYGWDNGVQVGTKIFLENYFSWSVFDVWHKISIPLSDMSLVDETIDSLRVQIETIDTKSPKFYLDDIQIEETGNPITFTLRPVKNTWLYINTLVYGLVDAYDSTLLNGTMPNLSYNKLLGMNSLPGGITWTEYLAGELTATFTVHNLMDALELPNASIKTVGGDGTNTWLTLEFRFDYPIVLKAEDGDKLTITLTDDLTDLLRLRAYTSGKWEPRNLDGSSVI